MKYYLERRDPDFESKMRQVLLVYREVALQNESSGEGGPSPGVITVSVDEKPGVQAIANVAPDLPPVPGQHPCVARDYEYNRLGTCSILAALDLHNGRVTARVERRHRSREFILLLQDLDQSYPGRMHDPIDLGQSFLSHFQGNAGVSGDASEPLQIRAYADPQVLAEHYRDPVWEDGADVFEAYPGGVLGGASRTNPEGDRGDQRRTAGSPLVHRWRKFEALEGAFV